MTAVSHWLSQETLREFHLDQPIRTIYNFLDERKFSPVPRQACPFCRDNEKIIMHISNFRPVKRVTDVIRTFKRVLEQVDARLVMIGEGPERMSAVGVAKQLGIADKITFQGNVENIEDILPCAELVFQPSEHESFGLVPLEAMACSVPVLGTASGGITEVVEHGASGFLCEVGDTETMAAHAIDLLQDEDKRRRMGEAGRKRALSEFGRERIVSQYEALYEEVIEMRKRGLHAPGRHHV